MRELREYQKEAVKRINEYWNSNEKKAKICMATGLGRTAIIVSSLQMMFQTRRNISIAILSLYRVNCEQLLSACNDILKKFEVAMHSRDFKGQDILITTYQDAINNQSNLNVFDIVICYDADSLKTDSYISSICGNKTKVLGLLTDKKSSKGWFNDAKCLFSYTLEEFVRNGYDVFGIEGDVIQTFMIPMMEAQGYYDIRQEEKIGILNKNSLRADIVAQKEKRRVICEIKPYRSLYVPNMVIDSAIKQMITYKNLAMKNAVGADEDVLFILVLFCEVNNGLKLNVLEKEKIIIWDIANLIYMSYGNDELTNQLARCVPYPIEHLEAKKPEHSIRLVKEYMDNNPVLTVEERYLTQLKECKSGRKDQADKKYENICTDIIKYLFGTEFYKISEQNETDDKMFRMDLLCSLKGTTEFWKFLINFYKTKFVVFEYKNYKEHIPQNLIYVTEKYLFHAALRNVAFIISRKGFDSNAQKAAMGCLRENGKLIVDINDDDLIKMVSMKENGQEPSDYLLNKVESFLMAISK